MSEEITRETAKYWWLRCVACSEASMTTQMRGFGYKEPVYEQAIHPFSGGFMHQGHATGLLTGAVMAAGFVVRERFSDDAIRSGATLHAAIHLAKPFPKYSESVNCQEITGTDLTTLRGRFRYFKEGQGRTCGRLHLKWAPRAHHLIDTSLMEYWESKPEGSRANCAVRSMQELEARTGQNTGISTSIAGFAGGVGLSGNVCGALVAGVYWLAVIQQLGRKRKKRDSRIRGSVEELFGITYWGDLTRLRLAFVKQFGSELCIDIIGRHFNDAADHGLFVEQDGCMSITKFIADWVAEHF